MRPGCPHDAGNMANARAMKLGQSRIDAASDERCCHCQLLIQINSQKQSKNI